MAISSEPTESSSCRKRMFRSRQDRTLLVAETLTKWEECNVQLDSCKNEIKSVRKAPSIRLKKGMKGKGGPENSSCNYRGVIADIREPKEKRSWLSTFENVDDVAFSYDKAAKSGSCACLNFSDYCSVATPPNICLTATPTSSNCINYSANISMKLVTPNLRNEDGNESNNNNTLHVAATKAATPSRTQQVEESKDEWCNIEDESKCFWDDGQEYSMNEMLSLNEIDAYFERSPIRDIESVLGHDVGQLWFSTVDRQAAGVLEL